ncbi:unannotated protein [freshwater metagenome]|uniref:Unannotated protein n=1 Tax=freshwater metagenome TaxID=449393 RepID=A0A6J7Q705_9ZZZZ
MDKTLRRQPVLLQGWRVPDPSRTVSTKQVIIRIGNSHPIDRANALAQGLTVGQLRSALTAGRLVSLQPGTLLPAQVWEAAEGRQRHLFAVTAALLRHPRAIVSHGSAAAIHDLPFDRVRPHVVIDPVLGEVPIVELTQPGKGRHAHRLRIFPGVAPSAHLDELLGFPCTNIARTVLDLCINLPPPEAQALIDMGLRRLISTNTPNRNIRRLARDPVHRDYATNSMLTTCAGFSGRRGLKALATKLRAGEPAAESVLESISRWQMQTHKLLMPQCGVPVLGDDGRTYWADFTWEHLKLIGEADGFSKYVNRSDHVSEKLRQEALERAGWSVVRWTWHEAVVTPLVMINRIQNAIARRQLPGRRTA